METKDLISHIPEDDRMLSNEELSRITGGGSPSPDPTPAPSPEPLPPEASSIVGRAKDELGKPYAWGAVGPDAYDASGLVSYCVTGVHARRWTPGSLMSCPRVSNPQPGDVCVSNSHCGIYVAPGQMIHAPTFGQSVCCGPIQSGMIIVRP